MFSGNWIFSPQNKTFCTILATNSMSYSTLLYNSAGKIRKKSVVNLARKLAGICRLCSYKGRYVTSQRKQLRIRTNVKNRFAASFPAKYCRASFFASRYNRVGLFYSCASLLGLRYFYEVVTDSLLCQAFNWICKKSSICSLIYKVFSNSLQWPKSLKIYLYLNILDNLWSN